MSEMDSVGTVSRRENSRFDGFGQGIFRRGPRLLGTAMILWVKPQLSPAQHLPQASIISESAPPVDPFLSTMRPHVALTGDSTR
jgi:hypothetical protein